MKFAKIISLALAILLTAGSVAFTLSASAEEDSLTVHYSKIQRGNVDNGGWVDIDNEYGDAQMGTVVKISPIPGTTAAGNALVDGYSISNLGIDLTKYNYMTVEYKLVSSYSGDIKPYFRMLPGPDRSLTKDSTFRSPEGLERDKWSSFTLNIGAVIKPLVAEGKKNLSQVHFAPFGDVAITVIPQNDYILIRNLIFTVENPNPDRLHQISFEAGATGAEGTAPAVISGKTGDKIKLPEIPFTFANMTAAGWYCETDGKLYKPGDEFTVGESSVSFVVRWMEKVVAQDLIDLDFATYSNGICNGVDTARLNIIDYEGRKVVEVVPNVESANGGSIILDGWSYGGAKINISAYDTLIVEYKYVTSSPVSGKPKFNVMKQTTFTGITYLEALEDIVANRWATFSVDLSPVREKILEGVNPIIMQAHIYPLGDNKVTTLNADDRIYVSKIYVIPKTSLGTVYHESYINGYADGTFGVSGNMTRAEACTIVARLAAGGDASVPADKTTAFTDISADAWYHKYISYVESLGYLGSYSGTFEPDRAITRAEFVELVYNMGLLVDNGKNGSFTDVSADHPKAEVIAAAGKAGLVNGYDNGDGTFAFRPDATITRAEVVKVINNAYGKTPSEHGIFENSRSVFSDVTSEHWAYADIIDAAVGHISYLDADGKEVWITRIGVSAEAEDFEPDYAAGEAKAAEVEALLASRIAEIRSTPNTEFSGIKGTTYYVSSSDGSDGNDGKSPEKPFKTATHAGLYAKNGDLVLFKRGDTWRERWTAVSGVTYSAYGEGEKPIFNGNLFGDVANEKYWSLVEGTNNIWKFSEGTSDVGNIVVNGSDTIEKIVPKLVGSGYHLDNKPVELIEMFSKNKTFVNIYASVSDGNTDINAMTSTLYVRCDEGNPGKVYGSIEIANRGHIISARSNNTFDNLKLLYTGGHGISMGTVNDVRFRNLELGFIGGCAQHFSNGAMTRYGNGIEIYGGCNGFYIDNCYVYECYDAGITHQHSGGGSNAIYEENVYFTNNVIERCIYNIEYFLGKADTVATERIMRNINYTGNLLARSGEGWGMSPSRSASVKGWEMSYNESDGFRIENNIFYLDKVNACDLGAGSAVWLPRFSGNVYIQRYGNTFTKIGANGSTQYKFNGKAAETLENLGEKEFELYYVKAE